MALALAGCGGASEGGEGAGSGVLELSWTPPTAKVVTAVSATGGESVCSAETSARARQPD